MTVKELIEVSPCCNILEITVRKEGHGQWIQGYRIGKDAKLFPVEITKEVLEKHKLERSGSCVYLEDGQEIDCYHAIRLPMKVICKDVRKIPDYIGNLEICEVIPRRVPRLHDKPMETNDHEYDIECYPEGWEEPGPEPKEEKDLEGQIRMEDLLHIGGQNDGTFI